MEIIPATTAAEAIIRKIDTIRSASHQRQHINLHRSLMEIIPAAIIRKIDKPRLDSHRGQHNNIGADRSRSDSSDTATVLIIMTGHVVDIALTTMAEPTIGESDGLQL
jgi:hypothetical protein